MLLTFIRLLLIDFTDDLIQDYCLVSATQSRSYQWQFGVSTRQSQRDFSREDVGLRNGLVSEESIIVYETPPAESLQFVRIIWLDKSGITQHSL